MADSKASKDLEMVDGHLMWLFNTLSARLRSSNVFEYSEYNRAAQLGQAIVDTKREQRIQNEAKNQDTPDADAEQTSKNLKDLETVDNLLTALFKILSHRMRSSAAFKYGDYDRAALLGKAIADVKCEQRILNEKRDGQKQSTTTVGQKHKA